MAKISTYEEVLLPKLEDKLIGTSVGGEPQDATFNFTLQQLLDLFVPNIPSNNLQGVLDLGNTATQDINLTGTINTVDLNATGNTLLKNTYLNGPVRISGPLSDVYNSAGSSGQVLSTTATSVKWITLPTYVELTATSPLVYNNITGNISILQSSATTNGYLSSANWNTFNQKQAAISLTTDGSSGASTFLFNTLNIPEYTLSGLGGVPSSRTLTINGVTHDLSANRSWVISGGINSVTATSPAFSSGGANPNITIQEAGPTQNGYLSSSDWTIFNNKQTALGFTPENVANKVTTISSASTNTEYPTAKLLYDSLSGLGGVSAVTATSPVSSSGGSTPDISISQSGAATDGYLSTTDWNTFNNKQDAGDYITSLTGEATATGPGAATVTLGNSAVIGKVLTGLSTSTGGSIVAADSILTAFGKVQNQITGLVGGVTYQGVWNAATNVPPLTSSVGTQGYYYIVNVAGSTNLNGITDWKVGDWAIFNGTVWNKVDNTDSITSVTATSPILSSGGTTPDISIPQSNISTDGYLSATDWNTFNQKQAALGYTPEDVANKVTTVSAASTDIEYPSAKLLYDYIGGGGVSGYVYWKLGAGTSSTPTYNYGTLYNWYAVTDVRGIAPAGWHVPDWIEAYDLYLAVNGGVDGGQKLKSADPTFWSPSTGTDVYGFNMKGSGFRDSVGIFAGLNSLGYFWQTTSTNPTQGQGSNFQATDDFYQQWSVLVKIQGAPIRLLKDDSIDTGTVTDYDGNVYPTVTIGTQVWMAENLIVEHYNNGDPIPNVTSDSAWISLTTGALCYYNNDPDNSHTGGGTSFYNVYNQNEVTFKDTASVSWTKTQVDANTIEIEANVSVTGGVTDVTATSPLSSTGGATPDLSISQSSGSVDGYLSSTDWTTFDGKQDAITLTTTGTSGAATFVSNTLNIPDYGSGLSGYVPYTGATANVDLGIYTLTASSVNSSIFQNTSNYKIELSTIGIIALTNNSSVWQFNIGGELQVPGDVIAGSYGGNRLSLASGANLQSLRDGTVRLSGGTTGSESSRLTFTSDGAIGLGTTPSYGTSGQVLTSNGSSAASWSTPSTGLTSVGLSMPSAFSVGSSPLTSNGTITVTGAGATTQYIDGTGALQTFPTIITEAQNLITEVYNETGATLTKGTVVYINGGHGNLPTVTKALATSDATSAQTYGVVQLDITNNNNGHVVVIGNLGDLDTFAYAPGTQLYLSSTTAGQWTDIKQYAPAHLVYVGVVVRQHPTQGIVEVRIQNGFEMDELHNVSAQSPPSNGILQYITATSLWTAVAGSTTNISEGTNLYYTDARARSAVSLTTTGSSGASTYSSLTGVLNVPTYTLSGLGGVPTSRQLTVNGTAYDLSADRSWSVGTVTSVAALTLGTTGTDLSSSVATGTTTPVITLNVPTASASNRGALSSTDWSAFNAKQNALSGSGIVKSTSGTISYVSGTSSQFVKGDGSLDSSVYITSSGTANIAGGSLGAIPYQSAVNTTTVLAATSTANKILLSGASAAPTWSIPTFPNASATTRKIIVSDGTNWVASTETYAVPGTSGNVLTSDGTNWVSSPASGGGSTFTVSVISTNTAAVKNYIYVLTASLTLTLPASPSVGDTLKVSNQSGVLTCVIARNSLNIMGLAQDLTIDKLNIGMELVYVNSTYGWVII